MPRTMKGRIPCEPIRRAILEYCERYDTYPLRVEQAPRACGGLTVREESAISPCRVLAWEAGIKPNTLEGIVSGRSATIEFDMADRLLCAMGQVELWWTDLRDVYYAVDLSEPAAVAA